MINSQDNIEPLIEWKDIYSMGNEALDFEHKELIGQINAVHALAERSGSSGAEVDIPGALAEILNLVSAHFALEEKEMRATAYKGFADHKADHEKLLDEICDVMEKVEEVGADGLTKSLSALLETWFSAHFQTFDRQYHTSGL